MGEVQFHSKVNKCSFRTYSVVLNGIAWLSSLNSEKFWKSVFLRKIILISPTKKVKRKKR
ncbi:hypothetical protein BSM4216_3218 [Bacillus smithii]|nr:hypothetical protein BSM4216_3218 [Bacillus smithii]